MWVQTPTCKVDVDVTVYVAYPAASEVIRTNRHRLRLAGSACR
jgi:hypothetical protein